MIDTATLTKARNEIGRLNRELAELHLEEERCKLKRGRLEADKAKVQTLVDMAELTQRLAQIPADPTTPSFKMDGTAGGAVAGHDRQGRFVNGHSEYAARRRRLAEIVQTLVAEFDPTPSQMRLLAIAARHMDDAERCRSAIARTRATNAARRLLKDIPRKPQSVPPAADQAALALEFLLNKPDGV